MTFTIAMVVLSATYICLLVAASIAHARDRYNGFVRIEVVGLGVTIVCLTASAIWGESLITLAIWVFNVGMQSFGVRQSRRYRREWLGWQDPHLLHVCTEDCPRWADYNRSARA